MKKIIVLPIFLLFFVFFKTPALAASVTISPSQDTYVYSAAVNAASGGSRDMVSFWDRLNSNQGIVFIKFPVNQIPANATINSATLTLYQNDSSGQNQIWLVAMKVTSDWNNNITWATKPNWEPGFSMTSVDLSLSYKTWDLKKLVQGWVNGTIPNYGTALMPPGLGNNVYNRTFSSNEDPQVNRRPTLTVDYTVPNAAQNAGVNINFRITPIVIKITPFVQNVGNVANNNEALTVSNVQAQTSLSTATITWQTNKNSSSYVYYGNAADGVNRFDKQAGQNDSVTNHSVSLNGLIPNNKYSFKAASVDATANTTYAPLAYFSTLNEAPAGAYDNVLPETPTPTVADQNPISEMQNGVENKVAEYMIQQSSSSSQTATADADSNSKLLSSNNPLVIIAGWTGTNRMAGIVMIIIGILSLASAFIIFETGRRVHGHIKRRLKKKKR